MQTPRKRTALLSAIAIGTVATMGLGFALWTETLNVAAAVNTGSLDVAFAAPTVTDNETGGQDDAQCAAVTNGDGALDVTLTNAYPGYTCTIATQVINSGTVDAVVADLDEDAGSTPSSNGKITIAPTGGPGVGDVIPNGGTSAGPTYTVAVDSSATEADVAEGAVYTIGAWIDFENATP